MVDLALEKLIVIIANLRNELHNLDYQEERYDEMENRLHDLEDRLIHEFGPYLTETLQQIHDERCNEREILTPIAYIARNYIKRVDNSYDVEPGHGALVDVDQRTGTPCYMVIVPGPLRILLVKGDNTREQVWEA
jgi:hypothetical protein